MNINDRCPFCCKNQSSIPTIYTVDTVCWTFSIGRIHLHRPAFVLSFPPAVDGTKTQINLIDTASHGCRTPCPPRLPPPPHASLPFREAICCVISMLHTMLTASFVVASYPLLWQMMYTSSCTTAKHHKCSSLNLVSRTLATSFCCATTFCRV